MLAYTINSSKIQNNIFIPKYYDPVLREQLNQLSATHTLCSLGELIDEGTISVQNGLGHRQYSFHKNIRYY